MGKKPAKPKRPVPSYEEVSKSRWTAAVRTIMDYSLGTLWWVDESLWQELLPVYDRNSTRKEHPGLSILTHPVQDLYSQIPILHGTSKGQGVLVQGITAREPTRLTSFGSLLAPVFVVESVPYGGAARVRGNHEKSRITAKEEQDLRRFLKRERIMS